MAASRGLSKQLVPIFVGGGLDTKTDPRLVQAGSLLELENMYYLRTGELRLRNGFTRRTTSATEIRGLARMPSSGGLGHVWSNSNNGIRYQPSPVLSAAAGGGSGNVEDGPEPGPIAIANISQVTAEAPTSTGSPSLRDHVDPDVGVVGTVARLAAHPLLGGTINYSAYRLDLASDGLAGTSTGGSLTAGSRVQVVPGGSTYLVQFLVNTAAPPSLLATVTTVATGAVANFTVALNLVAAAQPWFDVKPIPGGNNIAVAFRNTAGGVTCCIFNPATGAVTSSVTTAAADASQCLGWLDDSLATGNAYLATAGSVSGLVVRAMSITTMVVSATNVISAGATTNVRNVTGYINTGATDYVVLWSVDNATVYNRLIRRAAWTGAAAIIDFCRGMNLASVAWKYDGVYYVVGSYDSTTQACYSVMPDMDTAVGIIPQASVGIFAAGYAGGARVAQSSLAHVSGGSAANIFHLGLSVYQKVGAPNGAFTFVRTGALVTLTFMAQIKPKALGAKSLFIPGGILSLHDGARVQYATPPLAVEALGLTPSATGSMTAGATYFYVGLYRYVDSDGRIMRGPPSVPISVTLGGGDGRVTVAASTLRILGAQNTHGSIPQLELYRAGPAAAFATTYNKVGEVQNDPTVDTVSFIDTLSDAAANAGELLYTSGNVLDNFAFPPCAQIEACAGRLWGINEEYPTELRYSKEYKQGTGLAGHPLQALRLEGDGFGRLMAVAAMDGRPVGLKASSIWVVSGDGPNDKGQGAFQTQAVSLNLGTSIPGSVVSTPDGLMFQSAKGIYLLDRGLGLQYVGAPVEQYTSAANVVDASLVDGYTQVRFVMASGRCLVWDYHHKRWTTFQLRVGASTVVACANIAAGWCYALADGTIMQETAGVYSDVMGSATAIVPRVGFPHLALAGINGYQRVRGVQILGEFVGNHTLSAQFEYDYSGSVTETRSLAITAGAYQYDVPIGKDINGADTQKSQALKLTLTTSVQAAGSGAFRLSGVSLIVGVKRGTGIPQTKRLS